MKRLTNGGFRNGGRPGGVRTLRRTANGIPRKPRARVLSTAETAPCTCPDFCERDHGND
jgi:hypothetical protein